MFYQSAVLCIDFSPLNKHIGSGSVRAPAAIHGLFAIRPSTDAIDNKGVIPFSNHFDTFGIFTRDIETLTQASSVLYNQRAEIPSCFKVR